MTGWKSRLKDIDYKKYAMLFLASLVIVLFFAAGDYYIHTLSEEYAVPSYYFKNKVTFGTIIGFFALVLAFAKKLNSYLSALVFSATVSVLLQVRYYLEGYPKDFVFEFLLWHFLILIFCSTILLKLGWDFLNNKSGHSKAATDRKA